MIIKNILSVIFIIFSLFSLNAFAYLYGVRITVNNNTGGNLLLLFEGDNNIDKYHPFFSIRKEFLENSGRFHLKANSKSIIYLDNYDRSAWLYQSKTTNYKIIKRNKNNQDILLSKGEIVIVTGATMWHMYAYFDSEYPIKRSKYYGFYIIRSMPDYNHSVFDTSGNIADLTLDIKYNSNYTCRLMYDDYDNQSLREYYQLIEDLDGIEEVISGC